MQYMISYLYSFIMCVILFYLQYYYVYYIDCNFKYFVRNRYIFKVYDIDNFMVIIILIGNNNYVFIIDIIMDDLFFQIFKFWNDFICEIIVYMGQEFLFSVIMCCNYDVIFNFVYLRQVLFLF